MEQNDFNPRSPGESDKFNFSFFLSDRKFQSTLSWGERRAGLRTLEETSRRFQSTLSWGERQIREFKSIYEVEFQSTLSWGERHLLNLVYQCGNYFNPRSPGESDYRCENSLPALYDFNPRSPGESDMKTFRGMSQFPRFQSTLSWGERRV